MMVTMQDVAEFAGVSKASVSRVVNGLPASVETYNKVSIAMKSLGYHPNLIARALTTKKNSVVGVILAEYLTSDRMITEFFAQLLERMNDLKKPLIVVRNNGDLSSLLKCYNSLVEQCCEGIIYLTGTPNDRCFLSRVRREFIPLAIVYGYQLGTNSCITTRLGANDCGAEQQYVSMDEGSNQTLEYIGNPVKLSKL
jgi:DNA-binding LacI/PurR family transcriptional regulator